METKKIVIATLTLARDDNEAELIRQALKKLCSFGLPVFVTDGGSLPSFVDFLKTLPNIQICAPVKGLWAQASSSLRAAAAQHPQYIFYTEPDKLLFFEEHLTVFFRKALPGKGIVLASRNREAFKTFPPFQQFTETTINTCCTERTRQPCDHTYGPFLLSPALVSRMEQLPDDIGWGWRSYAFALAAREGVEVDAVEGFYQCPPAQRNEDAAARLYRMKQLAQNIHGLTLLPL